MNASELKEKLVAREQKRLAQLQAGLNRRIAILDAMPDEHCDQVNLITDVQFQGASGSIHLDALGLAGLAAIMDTYKPVPLVHIKGGTFRITCPADRAEREIDKNRGGEATEIAPFTIKIDQAGRSHGAELECTWWSDLTPDVRVQVQVKVWGGDEMPKHTIYASMPAWAGYTIQYRTSHGERYVENCNARLDLLPTPQRIKWASGSRSNGNQFTYYWPGRPEMRVSDLVVRETK